MPYSTSSRQLSFAEVFENYPARSPSETLLYKVIQENLEAFIQLTESDPNRKGLPDYVKKEFYEYLGCGILAKGFLRLQCDLPYRPDSSVEFKVSLAEPTKPLGAEYEFSCQ